MKQLTCEMCGSTDLIKQDGFFVCQTCGTKYSVEEAKKMMIEGTVDIQGTVKVDNSAFVEKYLTNARRAKQKEDWAETEKYYNMVEQNDPTNIEAIFYSTFARVKLALLEAETKDKRQGVFNVLVKSVSIIDDNYDNKNKELQKLLFEIMDDIKGLKTGKIVPTTHLQEYVTKNGYGNVVDRNQVIENDSLDVTYNMINKVIEAYVDSLANIIIVQCKDLSKEEILEKALETLKNGYPEFALHYFSEYIKKNTNSPIGYVGKACAIYYTNGNIKNALENLRKAISYTASNDKEKDNLKFIINYQNNDDITLLMAASIHYDYEVVKYLVEYGADINAESHKATALWIICRKKPDESNIEAARKIAKFLLDNGAKADVTNTGGVALYNKHTDSEIAKMLLEKYPYLEKGTAAGGGGCYVATAVYGSYDCPEVWTLRRYRDYTLGSTWHGRAFIKTYYAISPTLVKWFGETEWFKKMWRGTLDRMVANLQEKGVENTPYEDQNW
ncbi:MAG: ankyrin repeat domain-containing protein [Clostridia bacterium]|nr:ankyrin repeat domain-containing protein [Clostridia bacterium]